MNQLERIFLYRYGVRFSERILLPALIGRIEPGPGRQRDRSGLPDIDPVVTEYELMETVGKYQLSNTFMIYALILFLSLIAFAVSSLLKLVSVLFLMPMGIAVLIHIVGQLSAFIFWLGASRRIRQRWKEWQEIADREVLLEKIEYYARATSSEIIAKILVEIEKAKKLQEQQAEKARSYSAIGTETMQLFEEMMDKREEKNRWKSRVLNVVAFFAGYLVEKSLDRILLAITIGGFRGA